MLCFSPPCSLFSLRVFFRSSGPRVGEVSVVVAAVAYGDLRKGPKFYIHTHTQTHTYTFIYIYVYTRSGEVSSSVVRLLPLAHLTGSLSDVVQFVCDGPNTSPVDTRQQYITRPTVQTVVPAPAITTYPPLSRFPFACNLDRTHTPKNFAAPLPTTQVRRRGSPRTTASLPDL